jgi:bla regulator protein blaR1
MIAYGMLYTIAVGLPIALAAIAIAAVLRRHGRPERFVWLGALATAFVLPVVALLDPLARGASVVPAPPETGVIGLPAVVVVPTEAPAMGFGDLLVAAWLLASGVLILRWAIAALRLSRASRSWRPGSVDGEPVWRTEKLGPAVAGTFRPRVLVPAWLDSLPASQRALVLLHEQEHIRARDPVLIALARVTRILTPWNPVVWLLSARLVRAVELDCDRRVLRRNTDVATYGRTLLTVSERRPGRLVAVAAFAESEAPLRSRILAMTTPSTTISVVALLTSMVLGVVLLIGALEIPVPAVSIQIGVQPAGSQEGTDSGEPGPSEALEGLPDPVTEVRSGARADELPRADAERRGRADAAPPSAEETIDRLRLEATSRTDARSAERVVGEPDRPRRLRPADLHPLHRPAQHPEPRADRPRDGRRLSGAPS